MCTTRTFRDELYNGVRQGGGRALSTLWGKRTHSDVLSDFKRGRPETTPQLSGQKVEQSQLRDDEKIHRDEDMNTRTHNFMYLNCVVGQKPVTA